MNFREGPNVHELLSSEAFGFPEKTRGPLLGSLKWNQGFDLSTSWKHVALVLSLSGGIYERKF